MVQVACAAPPQKEDQAPLPSVKAQTQTHMYTQVHKIKNEKFLFIYLLF